MWPDGADELLGLMRELAKEKALWTGPFLKYELYFFQIKRSCTMM